ncbi:isochorismatase family protein [uncultured Bacteroides sp.]|uniref:isochorismatase family protein n=1 Tax=uncultured Bacteroides sp. TaxID=162156 RepID=UPI00262E7746|nr:isochorismatase family protein [uncultured Bacteroides sp.]
MKKLLLIVDPQVDFIYGSLPVPHATEAMDLLADYIKQKDGEYVAKIVTTDWHPYHHCSFRENHGQWPMHCVQYSVGAAIYSALLKPLYTTEGEVFVLRKGVDVDTEEYSIFKNTEAAEKIHEVVIANGIERIDLCGLAGDVCVTNTLEDGVAIYGASMFHVLTDYAPSLDGGKKLEKTIAELSVSK